jgi:hypothetical protein
MVQERIAVGHCIQEAIDRRSRQVQAARKTLRKISWLEQDL